MRSLLKFLLTHFYKPLLQKYLQRDRWYSHDGLRLMVKKGVFHPGFFGSSKVFASFLKEADLEGKAFLEMGCGSGLLSLLAAKRGARVTAVDISPAAVETTRINASDNGLKLTVIRSALFENVPERAFDYICCNPPYFDKTPGAFPEYAWYCGENFEFFRGFFAAFPEFTHENSQVLMILSEVCEMEVIFKLAEEHKLQMKAVYSENRLLETFIIYKISAIK